MWQNGTFPVCWGEVAARLSLSSAMLAHRSQEHRPEALALAQRMFGSLDKEQLRYMKDPEQSLERPLQYMTNLLSGDALAYYPAAYWYGKCHNLW